MKKILFLIVVLITALSVTACFRPRKSNNPPTDVPVAAATQTQAPVVPTQTAQVADTATTVPTETPAPTSTPEVVSTATQSQPSAAAASSAQLDQTLNDLEALLNNTDTKVDIP